MCIFLWPVIFIAGVSLRITTDRAILLTRETEFENVSLLIKSKASMKQGLGQGRNTGGHMLQ